MSSVNVAGATHAARHAPGSADSLSATYAPLRTFDVMAYGAVGNGTTDDTTAVQSAISAANGAGGGIVQLPANKTFLCTDLTLYANTAIEGAGWGTILKQKFVAGDGHYLLNVNPGSGGTTDPTQNTVGIAVRNIQLRGTCDVDGFEEFVHLLNLNAVSGVVVSNVYFKGFRGDGIYLGSGNNAGIERHNVNVRIRDCVFDGINHNNRCAISVIDCTGLFVTNNWFANCTTSSMPSAIDVEPNSTTYSRCRDIHIAENHFETQGPGTACVGINLRPQAGLTTVARGFWVVDNTMDLTDTISGSGAFGINVANVPEQTNSDDTTVPHAVTIRGNKIYGGRKALQMYGMRGVDIDRNTIDGSWDASNIGDIGAKCDDARIRGNHFRQIGFDATSFASALMVWDNLRLVIEDNDFDNNGLSSGGPSGVGITLGSGATTSQVHIKGNRFYGSRQTDALYMSGHTTTPATNDWSRNVDGTANGYDRKFGTELRNPPGIAKNYTSSSSFTTATTIGSANDGRYFRITEPQVISKIAIHVVTASGNVSVSLMKPDGSGGWKRVATSGAVACPAAGYAELSLGASYGVQPGDALALSADNTTATFIGLGANGLTSNLFVGEAQQQSTAHPIPSSVGSGSLTSQTNRVLALRGVA